MVETEDFDFTTTSFFVTCGINLAVAFLLLIVFFILRLKRGDRKTLSEYLYENYNTYSKMFSG